MFTIPNVLTILRLIAVPVFIFASLRGDFLLAFILFVSAALTDMFDGMIARRFNQRSRLGAILDPAADKTMLVCGYLFYTLYDNVPLVRIPEWLTFAVFIRDFLIIFFAYLLWTRVQVKRFPPSWAGKTSTVLQAAALGIVIGVNAFIPSLLWLAELMFRIALVITLYSGWDYMRRAKRMLEDAFAAAA
ncbi:MAG TPA: CDP-alcohol phosphatidyltransferase family protein [Thermoanaerobaculia bacterium]|jgi:cardiolipin synthase